MFLYQDDKTGLYGLQDENQKKITPAQYLDFGTSQNGICLVQHSNKKFGAMDLLGNAIIPFEYDYIMNDDDSNQFIVGIDEKYGVMNREGKTLLPMQYEYISFLNHGYAAFSVDRKFGIVNENNQIIVPASYQGIYTNNSTHFIAMDDNNYKLVNIKINKTVANGYDYISTTDEPNLFLALKDGKYGYLDGTGKIVIPLIYNNATTFRDGEAYVITTQDEAIIINTKGEKVKSVLAPQDELNDEEKEALRNIEKSLKRFYGSRGKRQSQTINCNLEKMVLINISTLTKESKPMIKKIIFILTMILVFSCNDKADKSEKQLTDNKKGKKLHKKSTETTPEVSVKKENQIEILIPKKYRDFGNENEVNSLTKAWFDLYESKGKYYLGNADYDIARGFSECSGDSTKIIHSKNNSVLLIGGAQLKLGEVNTVAIKKNKIWPNEKLKFQFGSEEYTLHAEGTVLSSEKVYTDNGEEIYQNVKNYKLHISKPNSVEQLFLEEESFNDTFVELLFIGDIDKDGKPDFIFGANRDYEEERVILYLSSQAKGKQMIKKVSEITIQFDC
ncbi:WG repeat-containing protein [Epilithonimonas sp.]|uniref:WG repeat-containing protein n=1 Tax=Epilithonimonas sp. TaxID=2894511 RepID=UPI00289C5718|nr:WG repeat-containing protein [Epilithonimonas sp.]